MALVIVMLQADGHVAWVILTLRADGHVAWVIVTLRAADSPIQILLLRHLSTLLEINSKRYTPTDLWCIRVMGDHTTSLSPQSSL